MKFKSNIIMPGRHRGKEVCFKKHKRTNGLSSLEREGGTGHTDTSFAGTYPCSGPETTAVAAAAAETDRFAAPAP